MHQVAQQLRRLKSFVAGEEQEADLDGGLGDDSIGDALEEEKSSNVSTDLEIDSDTESNILGRLMPEKLIPNGNPMTIDRMKTVRRDVEAVMEKHALTEGNEAILESFIAQLFKKQANAIEEPVQPLLDPARDETLLLKLADLEASLQLEHQNHRQLQLVLQ